MNPWKDTLWIAPERLKDLRAKHSLEQVHEVLRDLCAMLGYPYYAIEREVWILVPAKDSAYTSLKTERSLDEAGEFEVFFVVKDGSALTGPQGPLAFLDPVEARKASIRFGGVVKSHSDLARERAERSKLIIPA